MTPGHIISRPGEALLTDLYQLTMAFGYWHCGLAEREAVFHLTFRKSPFGGRFAIACGMAQAIEWLEGFAFAADDLDYLRSLSGNDGRRLFAEPFLNFLRDQPFTCDVDAMPEGTLAFPYQPLLRVTGPLWQAQIVETVLLTIINFQTLIATKASRVCHAAGNGTVLEFGLRRAQGIDGGLSASRAAFIGGCHATSNVLAGKLFGIPVRGTHAHSWVMAHEDELKAFRNYAAAMPNNSLFLVDTYDTLEGVRRACQVGRELQAAGHAMLGIRLDSGDLLELSRGARQILDAAGLTGAKIVASNDLDAPEILALRRAGAPIDIWGVGTKLATSYDQPALGGVYKLGAIRDDAGQWQPRIKLSNQEVKVSDPGILQIRRFAAAEKNLADAMFDSRIGVSAPTTIESLDGHDQLVVPTGAASHDLLVPVMRQGKINGPLPVATGVRRLVESQWSRFDPGLRDFENPAPYFVGRDQRLADARRELIQQVRKNFLP